MKIVKLWRHTQGRPVSGNRRRGIYVILHICGSVCGMCVDGGFFLCVSVGVIWLSDASVYYVSPRRITRLLSPTTAAFCGSLNLIQAIVFALTLWQNMFQA